MKRKLVSILLSLCILAGMLPVGSVMAAEPYIVLYYETEEDGTVTITDCNDEVASVDVPASINGNAVTKIAPEAFKNCSALTSVTIANSVTEIGEYAFQNCSGLTGVTIPNSVTTIGDGAFIGCSSLTSAVIPDSVTTMGMGTFIGCTSLRSVTIPDGVTTIEGEAFHGCTSLRSVSIPDSVTEIQVSAFSGCSSLTNLTIPDSVKKIANYAFYECSSLTSVTIPDGIAKIGDQTFNGCSRLARVTIPESVTEIGDSAFAGCSNLRDVYYIGTKSEWDSITIGEGNDPLLNAAISCTEEPEPEPEPEPEEVTTINLRLDDGVKYVPYSYTLEGAYSLSQDVSVQYVLDGTLPSGLSVDPGTGLISGVPMADGRWNFNVRLFQGTENTAVLSCSITVLDNTDAEVKRPNDYEIIIPVGTPDRNDPNHFYKDEYTAETMKIDGPYVEFRRLLIDGTVLTRDVDYTAEDGSTVITINSQTFQRFGEGTHTIAAEFRSTAEPNKIKRVAQNYTLTLAKPSTGSVSGGSGGGHSKPSVNASAQNQDPQQPQQQQPVIPFADVSPDAWFYEDVVWAYTEEIMQGVDATHFDPDGKVSQAVIVTVLARLAKVDLSTFAGKSEDGFPAGEYFSEAAVWAKRAGLLPSEGAFTGKETTSRNQMAVMLAKYLNSMGKDTTPPVQPVAFEDAAEMSQEGNNAFQTLYQYGIFRGTGGLKMEPNGSTTRAQFAALMHRIYNTANS